LCRSRATDDSTHLIRARRDVLIKYRLSFPSHISENSLLEVPKEKIVFNMKRVSRISAYRI
jgi:hypothetical protein